ncbi:ABC transporter ATP-binding protein [Paenibacillus validus]|uniref:ABC transporter ATP-binding protein n=1 Tax=Paenibacillus validus TaxID=44253 RepID=UPI000FDB7070|nr:ABC transporter ATP-binding protein [Paenibacillus validus]MED4600284.1 ABC transporter ATP-binding protein [Paenibacillus validus]MED4606981.1 ABC transporter ATP-binding protein [Paenibacillus validus]
MRAIVETVPSSKVTFAGIVKQFPGHSGEEPVYAVNKVSLDIEPGQLVTLLGPSGCGKTTTLRMLAGFETPTAGEISINGQTITHLPPNKRDVGMVFQSYALFPHMTVYDNVAYGLSIKPIPKSQVKERVDKVLALMHLDKMKDRLPSLLSGGQQQRVALARAVVTEPKVLLFDEPLSNLDAKLREYMRDELRKIQQRLGITSLYVTHDQAEAMAISDKVVIMNKGEIQQIGSPRKIYMRPCNQFVANFMGKANFLKAIVEQSDSRHIGLNLLGQRLVIPKDPIFEVKAGERVDCVIRPEFWSIDPEGKFQGTVERAIYLGPYVEYEVALGGQTVVVVDYMHHLHEPKSVGDLIRLGLSGQSITLLPPGQE